MRIVVENADEKTYGLVYDVMVEFHPELVEAGVWVTVLMVRGVTSSGKPVADNALLCGGLPALATVRVATPGDRKMGYRDVVIRIDEHQWREELHMENRVAMMDHELCHIGVRRDRTGSVRHDSEGRPMLKMVRHDAEMGVFFRIVRRHGQDAPDCYGARTLCSLVQDEMKMRRLEREMSNGLSRQAI